MIKSVMQAVELSTVSAGSVSGFTVASSELDHLGTMGSNGTLWSSSSPPLSVHAELVTVAPTIFPRVGYSILSFLMFINTVLSVFNNGLVIAVMVRNPSLLHPMNIFILSLAVSDLMIGLCGSLVVTITNYQGSFFISRAACVFQGFSVNYFGKFGCECLLCVVVGRRKQNDHEQTCSSFSLSHGDEL